MEKLSHNIYRMMINIERWYQGTIFLRMKIFSHKEQPLEITLTYVEWEWPPIRKRWGEIEQLFIQDISILPNSQVVWVGISYTSNIG